MNIIGEGSQVIVGFLKLNKMKFWSKVSNSLEETPGELKCTGKLSKIYIPIFYYMVDFLLLRPKLL